MCPRRRCDDADGARCSSLFAGALAGAGAEAARPAVRAVLVCAGAALLERLGLFDKMMMYSGGRGGWPKARYLGCVLRACFGESVFFGTRPKGVSRASRLISRPMLQ